jgi:hypothetical protein
MIEAGHIHDGGMNLQSISQKLKKAGDLRGEVIADGSAYFHARRRFT